MAIPRVFCRLHLLINKKELSVIFKQNKINKFTYFNRNIQFSGIRQFKSLVDLGNSLKKDKKQLEEIESSSSSSSDDSDTEEDDVKVEYHRGLPQVTVPLPSRKEKCIFFLKPISNTVGDFLNMLKKEDKGIDIATCKSIEGNRIASSNSIEKLLEDDFKLVINDRTYNVNCPKQERLTGEEIKRFDDIKMMVNQLYVELNVDEHNVKKEKEMIQESEVLKQELLPLENQIRELEVDAEKRGNWLAWGGLFLMSVQCGALARLTWWEYSWDIMEPVTYFVTYSTAMAMYSYYVLTKEEFILPSVTKRQKLIFLHKKAKKLGLDLNKYNQLHDQINKIDKQLLKIKKRNITKSKSVNETNVVDGGEEGVTLANFAKTLSKTIDTNNVK